MAVQHIIPAAETGERYASVLLGADEGIRARGKYLGHGGPGFTLRTYTHLMPSSERRTGKPVTSLCPAPYPQNHGPSRLIRSRPEEDVPVGALQG